MTFSLRTAQYSESEINASIMSVVHDLKDGVEEEKSHGVANAEASKAAPEAEKKETEAASTAMEVGEAASSSSESMQQEESVSEEDSEENRISDSPVEESTQDDMSD